MKEKSYKIRLAVMGVPTLVFAILIGIGFASSDTFVSVLWSLFEKLMVNLGWLVDLGCLGFVIFLIVMWIHPIGKTKFGGPDAKPKYSTWNWWAISLCAGIGTGIVFWGPVEPLLHTFSPAPGLGLEPGSNAAMMWAMEKSLLHWTITPYAIYVSAAVVIGYAYYNLKKPYTVSSGLVPLMGEKAMNKKTASIVDALTLFAITGGVAGSLGYGLLQIGSGLEQVFNIKPGPIVWVSIAAVIIITYSISSLSGMDKGIKWLSDKNAWMFIALLVFVLVFGPTSYILNLTTQSIGQFVGGFVESMTFTAPFADSELWPQWWDMYWFVDWLSFGPIVGLFLVKLCYGRTIREFITVNLFLPALFGMIWFGVFGGFALDLQMVQGIDLVGYMNTFGQEALTLKVLDYLPLAQIVKPLMLLLIGLSFVTLADSMTSTVSLMSIESKERLDEAPMSIKLFWGTLMGATSVIFVLNGGLEGIKVVKTIAGFPILFLEIIMVIGFIKYMIKLRKESEISEK
ncbi:MAG: BCCT family transporter [Peptostreptococcaceae bacterium]